MSPRFNLDEYEPVDARIQNFYTDHPNGRIITEIADMDGKQYIVRTEIYRDGKVDRPDATGFAQETIGQGNVNTTSALENAETSSIGRALANLGYSAKGKRPSREEMEKVQRQDVAGAQTVASPSQAQQAPRSQEVLTPPPSQSASPPQQSVPASPRPENGNRSGHGGNGDVPPAVTSPIDDAKQELLALINARLSDGDLTWQQIRPKANVAALKNGDPSPSRQEQLKDMGAESLRLLLTKIGSNA